MSEERPVPEQDAKGRFVSGNIGGGRPKGSRNKLAEHFVDDMYAAWKEHGSKAIEAMIADKPGDFVKTVAGLMPKDVNFNINDHSEMTDDELAGRVRQLAAQLAPFLTDGAGDVNEGAGGTESAVLTSRVH